MPKEGTGLLRKRTAIHSVRKKIRQRTLEGVKKSAIRGGWIREG